MIIAIDCSNIRYGGGITYVSGLVNNSCPHLNKFSKLVIIGYPHLLNQIKSKPYIQKIFINRANSKNPFLDNTIFQWAIWTLFKLPKIYRQNSCDLLFVPGTICLYKYCPYVTISRNMLPYSSGKVTGAKFFSKIKLIIIKYLQTKTMKSADHVIFMSKYACDTIKPLIQKSYKNISIIPHGIKQVFFKSIKKKKSKIFGTSLIYVSTFDSYKNQYNVAKAVSLLRNEGILCNLKMIGMISKNAQRVVFDIQKKFGKFTKIISHKNPYALLKEYKSSDLKVFASSVENMPFILLEAMAARIPICCSEVRPMTDILKNNAFYFDPNDPLSIKSSILCALKNPKKAKENAQKAYKEALTYSSKVNCVNTFKVFRQIYLKKSK